MWKKMNKEFEKMTIGQLRKLTEQYKELERENKILRTKYPNFKPLTKKEIKQTAEEIVAELEKLNSKRMK